MAIGYQNRSSYCNYNEAFTQYDQVRQPNGLPELLEILANSDIPMEEQRILEGGFGTGAYIDHLRHAVNEVYGVEGSREGFERAVQKMAGASNIHLQVGDILSLPYANKRFHGYMVNQVLHHLDTEPGFPNLDKFLRESKRVLKPGGVLTINTCSHAHLDPSDGVFWNFSYIEKAARAMQARYVPVEDLITRLEALQFDELAATIPSGRIFQSQYYTDPLTVLDPSFHRGDSVYSFLAPEEIAEANDRISLGIEDGSVYERMKRAAGRAAEIGEAIIISARKPD